MKDIVAIPAAVTNPMAALGTYGMKSVGALSKLRRRIPNPPLHLIHGGPSDANLMVATPTPYSMQYDEQNPPVPRLGYHFNGRVRDDHNGAARQWRGQLDLGPGFGFGSGSGPEATSTSPLPPPLRSFHQIGVNTVDCHSREASAAMATSVTAATTAAAATQECVLANRGPTWP
ncbi:hypothetical protein Vafri_18330 [Volvox africanus]|uniref:Uncharacterized protein n=1 Tax=Volvox africanus TaxID=51714 RepID=A0A8J4F7I9_9CHLO|nr:hypothetical protein Vafri_18330 [Volvox africanus]